MYYQRVSKEFLKPFIFLPRTLNAALGVENLASFDAKLFNYTNSMSPLHMSI